MKDLIKKVFSCEFYTRRSGKWFYEKNDTLSEKSIGEIAEHIIKMQKKKHDSDSFYSLKKVKYRGRTKIYIFEIIPGSDSLARKNNESTENFYLKIKYKN